MAAVLLGIVPNLDSDDDRARYRWLKNTDLHPDALEAQSSYESIAPRPGRFYSNVSDCLSTGNGTQNVDTVTSTNAASPQAAASTGSGDLATDSSGVGIDRVDARVSRSSPLRVDDSDRPQHPERRRDSYCPVNALPSPPTSPPADATGTRNSTRGMYVICC